MPCFGCVKMDYGVVEGIPDDFEVIGEDALEFQTSVTSSRQIKYTEPLYTKLSVNTAIICTGTPDPDIQWFSVNIGCGPTALDNADIAVHFNVRMPQCYVVRNTRKHEIWGIEETTSFRSFPFKVGRPFTIEFLLEEKETLMAVDGESYCTYKHRNPSPISAQWIQVTGIKDANLQVGRASKFPTMAPEPQKVPFRLRYGQEPAEDEPTWKPNVIGALPNGIEKGQQVVVVGKLRPILYMFTVDLMEEPRVWPKPHIHLTVSVRPYDEAQHSRQLVVLNAWFGAWGQERRQRTARLIPGSTIKLRIVLDGHESDTWSVYANNVIIGEMEIRAKASNIRGIRVHGDINPLQIYFCPVEELHQEDEVVPQRKESPAQIIKNIVNTIFEKDLQQQKDSKEYKSSEECKEPKSSKEHKDPKEGKSFVEEDPKEYKSSERHRNSNERKNSEEHKDPKEGKSFVEEDPKEYKSSERHRNSNERKNSEELKDPKEYKSSERHRNSNERKNSEEHQDPKEYKNSERHRNSNERKNSEEHKDPKEYTEYRSIEHTEQRPMEHTEHRSSENSESRPREHTEYKPMDTEQRPREHMKTRSSDSTEPSPREYGKSKEDEESKKN